MPIREIIRKAVADDATFYTMVMLLVAVASFGLGYQSASPFPATSATPVSTAVVPTPTTPTPIAQTSNAASAAGTAVVASKNGSKYHYLWCPGAGQMKEENKVFFASITEAKAAGYEPAANCTGLE